MIAAALMLVAVASSENEWSTIQTDKDGLVVESRTVKESPMPELRIHVVAHATPEMLAYAAWELRKDGVQSHYLDSRKIVSESDRDRMLFLTLKPPLIGARQCMLHETKSIDAATGACHVKFEAVPFDMKDSHPFAQLRGDWRLVPDGNGNTDVVYVTLVDVGGVPVLFARGPQQDAAVQTVREVVDRAQKRMQTQASAR